MKRTSKFACVALLFFMIFSGLAQAQITGERTIPAGRLAVFECTEKASWVVFPDKAAEGCWQVVEGGKMLVFASPVNGEFTLVAATVNGNMPVLHTFTFTNGSGDVTPSPAPEPQPEPAPVVKNLTENEKKKLRAAMESTVAAIDGGQLRTPQGVSAYFDKQLPASVTDAENAYLKAFTDASDVSSVAGIRKSFEMAIEELK